MKADALAPRDLFDGSVHYEIPAFQRPYVWSEEDQWAPLWQDVQRVAEKIVTAGDDQDALEGWVDISSGQSSSNQSRQSRVTSLDTP
ncbi:DUF262 domain-containing protein [Rhodococcus opacus]|uniref:DUF262 domain-containing protein n=1 Tax=Rhodococcus opacus TaxID=37919 RepID=UPI0024B8E1FA|nr:DUF262 domain-containing protein [Rhodococcus opacus]MDJ0417170.1 DUF262 domain-containing protein [Rhodococcus opacus]